MPSRDVVVVGASAGGVEALRDLVRELPEDLAACVLVVLHLPASAYSVLPSILSRSGKLPAVAAEDGAPVAPGRILVAPPDRHLVIRDGHVMLGRGPKENGHRPAIDVLFRSAARWYGPRTVGVVLSGTLDDGAAGLRAIAERGGAAVVQDPETALYDGMPSAALRAVPTAFCAAGADLARTVVKLSQEPVADLPERPVDRTLEMETDIPEMDEHALNDEDRPGVPAAMSCPDCSGAMFVLDEGSVLRYRCRVGHAWSPESLLAMQVEEAEGALWAAIRVLEEKAALHRELADRAEKHHRGLGRDYHRERAQEAQESAATLRELLRQPVGRTGPSPPPLSDQAG
jgi:two-component system chemotaxis response regulator CheB